LNLRDSHAALLNQPLLSILINKCYSSVAMLLLRYFFKIAIIWYLAVAQAAPPLIRHWSRLWQAWHVPWAQLWGGRKNCLAKVRISHTVSWTSILRPIQP